MKAQWVYLYVVYYRAAPTGLELRTSGSGKSVGKIAPFESDDDFCFSNCQWTLVPRVADPQRRHQVSIDALSRMDD